MPPRTFVVTVSETPERVVVEDVRNRRRAVVPDLAAVGRRIAELIDHASDRPDRTGDDRGVSES